MGNILRANISIVGTRTIIWHAFGPDALPLEKQERTGVAGNDPDEWRKTVLMNTDRQLYVSDRYIFGMLKEAAKYTKKGRGSIQVVLAATMQVENERILFYRDGRSLLVPAEPLPTDEDLPVFLSIHGVRNPSTKGRNIRYRVAASAGWECSFSVIWDRTLVSRNEFESVLRDAGILVGLADGRAFGYGRFCVRECAIAEI